MFAHISSYIDLILADYFTAATMLSFPFPSKVITLAGLHKIHDLNQLIPIQFELKMLYIAVLSDCDLYSTSRHVTLHECRVSVLCVINFGFLVQPFLGWASSIGREGPGKQAFLTVHDPYHSD